MIASQKFGNDRPTSDRIRIAWSAHLPRATAALMPSGIEMMIETMSEAKASIIVAGRAAAINCETGVPPMNERPKSKTNRPLMNAKYCAMNGWLSPSASRIRARSSSVMLPAP
ncbi:hypothetical protein FQZ97_1219740 [compost metagenome]